MEIWRYEPQTVVALSFPRLVSRSHQPPHHHFFPHVSSDCYSDMPKLHVTHDASRLHHSFFWIFHTACKTIHSSCNLSWRFLHTHSILYFCLPSVLSISCMRYPGSFLPRNSLIAGHSPQKLKSKGCEDNKSSTTHSKEPRSEKADLATMTPTSLSPMLGSFGTFTTL